MNISITDHQMGEAHVVALGGELDLYATPTVRQHLNALIKSRRRRLLVDLSDVTFIDSTAVGLLVGAARRARDANGSLDLICDNPRILGTLDFIGVEHFFIVHHSRADAELTPAESAHEPHSSPS
jgi:anti-sigma B factor antagonist